MNTKGRGEACARTDVGGHVVAALERGGRRRVARGLVLGGRGAAQRQRRRRQRRAARVRAAARHCGTASHRYLRSRHSSCSRPRARAPLSLTPHLPAVVIIDSFR